MSYVIPAFFGKYLFSDGKMGMMGCPKIYLLRAVEDPKGVFPTCPGTGRFSAFSRS
jgi:hypothetical protein